MSNFQFGLSQLKKSAKSLLQSNIKSSVNNNNYQRLQTDNNFSNANEYEYDARRVSDRPDTGYEKHITNAKQKQRRRTENGSRDNYSTRENLSAAPSYKYPTDNPVLKHDLLCSTSIIDIINGKPTNNNTIPLETIDELTFAIEQSAIAPSEMPRDVVRLSTIYTYPDAPTKPKPLSAAPRVWRLARHDLFDKATTNNINSILDVCTIAVKLPVHISQKDIRAQDNTKRFRNFVQYLHTNELVAVLACDSAGRVGFIVTSGSTTGTEGRYSALLYYAQVKKFLPLARQTYNNNNNNNNGIDVDAPSDGEFICQEPSQQHGGKSGASWRGGNNQLLRPFAPLSSISNNREPRGSKNGNSGFPFPRTHFGGRGSRRGYTALEQDEQARGYNGQGGRGSSRGALGNLSNQHPASNSNNFAKKPPPKPKSPKIIPPQHGNGVVISINANGGGFIQPNESHLQNRSILFINENVTGGPLKSKDNVQITYIRKDDRWVATKVERLPSQHEISMSLMEKKLPLVKKKREISSLPLPFEGEEYDPDSSYISTRYLEMLREELVDMGSSHLTASLERKLTQADALCAVRRRITSEVERICNVECVSGGMVDKFVDTIVNHVELVSIPSDEMIHCESLDDGMHMYADDDGEMHLIGQRITSLGKQDNSPALECSHSCRVWEQQLQVNSCVITLISILTTSIRPFAEIIDRLTVPDEERDIVRALLRTIANCSDPNCCTIRTPSTKDVQSGIRAVYNATMSIEGATFQQAKKNVEELVHSLGVSEDIIRSTIYDMFDKNMTTYMEDPLHHPTRRDNYPAHAETEEQKEERERYSRHSRNHENLLDNPPAVVGLERLSKGLFPGDVVPIGVMHCDKSDYSGGISIQSGGYAKKGTSVGCIESCCTVRNMNAISAAFPSVVNCGVVNGMFCINASASCSLLGEDHQHCPYTTEEMGAGTVGILNSFKETCDLRDICVVLIPFGGSRTGVMENVVNRILPAARKNISRVTTHAQNLSHSIEDMPPAGQRVIIDRTLHSVQESVRNQVAEYNAKHEDDGLSVVLPDKELVELAYESPLLPFASPDIDTLLKSLDTQKLDRDQRTTARISWLKEAAKRTGKYEPSTFVNSVPDMPPDMDRWLSEVRAEIMKKFSLDSHKKITVQQVLSVCGDRSVKAQCEKNSCTPKQLIQKALETGADRLGITVTELRGMNTEKQKAARKINLAKGSNAEVRKIATQTRYDNLKNKVLAAKEDYAIATCRYCQSREYFYLWSEYERRMSEYEMDCNKIFVPNTSKVAGCKKCRNHRIKKKRIKEEGPWKVVKVLVNPRNGNELGREVVIE